MRKETATLMDMFISEFSMKQAPNPLKVDPMDKMELGKMTDNIINLFSEKEMTYAEAYAVLKFVMKVLEYKSQFVGI